MMAKGHESVQCHSGLHGLQVRGSQPLIWLPSIQVIRLTRQGLPCGTSVAVAALHKLVHGCQCIWLHSLSVAHAAEILHGLSDGECMWGNSGMGLLTQLGALRKVLHC